MSPLSIIAFIVVILCEFSQRTVSQYGFFPVSRLQEVEYKIDTSLLIDGGVHISGQNKSKACCLPKDCQDILWSGKKRSGVYTIYPQGTGGFKVFCDMKTAGGGWTMLQKRQNGKIGFHRSWREYQYGFGDVKNEHWIGNQRIHQLTSQGWYELRIDMWDFKKNRRYAYYRIFKVGNKATGYRLTVGEYHGNAGDSFGGHTGKSFYTRDHDNRYRCSHDFKGGWWYGNCHSSNLNGLYLRGHHSSYADGVNWRHWLGYHYSLKRTEMKIRRQ